MPFPIGANARIRTNTPAENAYNALDASNREISLRQLRLSTGKRINNASDDVAGYITTRALTARNGSLKAALNSIGDANNVTNILMDSLDAINDLVTKIKDATSTAASGAMGSDEKVALAKSAYRMVQQIETVVNSTVFGGAQLLDGSYSANFIVSSTATNTLLSIEVNMRGNNQDFNIESNNFYLNNINSANFAGVSGLNLSSLNLVSSTTLGVFDPSTISTTLTSLSQALNNVNKVASFLGGISNRLTSQEDLIKNQITNYNAAISRLEDADVAKEQLSLVKAQFLQQASIVSLAQANQNPNSFMTLPG